MANTITNLKITDIEGEDVAAFVTKYRAGISFLRKADCHEGSNGIKYYKYIWSDSVDLLLEKLQATSTEDFNNVFKMLGTALEMESLDVTEGVSSLGKKAPVIEGDNIVKQLEMLLAMAQRKYMILSSQSKWTGVGTPGQSSFVGTVCWNCGEGGHTADKCMKPKNESALAQNRQAYRERFGRGSGRGRGSGGRNGRGRDGRGGGGRGGQRSPRGKWRPPTPQEHNKRIIDGKWYSYNPRANEGRRHWYVCDPQPGAGQSSSSSTTASSAGAHVTTQGMTSTTAPLVPSPHTSFTLDGVSELMPAGSGSVAQVSLDAARKAAQKQALVAQIQQTQAAYNKQMEELCKFE